MADVRSIQTRLAASLDGVGYKKSVPTLPAPHLERNPKLREFLEQAVGLVQPGNCLSPEQAKW